MKTFIIRNQMKIVKKKNRQKDFMDKDRQGSKNKQGSVKRQATDRKRQAKG
jgi:hypothetical protein